MYVLGEKTQSHQVDGSQSYCRNPPSFLRGGVIINGTSRVVALRFDYEGHLRFAILPMHAGTKESQLQFAGLVDCFVKNLGKP